MRKLMILVAISLTACAVMAAPRYIPFEVSIGTNATAEVTDSRPVNGIIDTVYLDAPPAAFTGLVSVVAAPTVSTNLTAVTLYTNAALIATATALPRIVPTDNEGAALSSLTVAEPYLCLGDTVTFSVTQASAQTGLTFKCWIKVK